ncbi:hypothetical protein HNY73_023131 [Argiope bruennichi]|uniref:C2HC/C3H-type domain-containing protein n=1 Tax=Argiope bruennichi TaxID=94029 RepID=A0A8T0E6U0_ARGBR|nr:hypothetical protein HNY73_023131 [Argiope bruennichi]
MTSESPYLHCRLCGIRYRSDKVVEHERQCCYQNPNSRSSSKSTIEESTPISSQESKVNGLRNKEEYYMRETKSSEKPSKDLTSNEESDDFPLNLTNRGGSKEREFQNKPTESQKTSETRITHREKTTTPESSDSPTEDRNETEIKSTYDKTTENRTDNRDSRSQENNQTKTANYSNTEKIDETSRNSSQSKERSPNSFGKSVYHQKSHSNEKHRAKINEDDSKKEKMSPQKSDEEQKKAMARTPYPSEEDIKIPPINAEEIGQTTDILENLPELSEHAEMAYGKHRKSLLPCVHCERTFTPSRLPIHEKACIERPKAREYIVPEDKDKKNEN